MYAFLLAHLDSSTLLTSSYSFLAVPYWAMKTTLAGGCRVYCFFWKMGFKRNRGAVRPSVLVCAVCVSTYRRINPAYPKWIHDYVLRISLSTIFGRLEKYDASLFPRNGVRVHKYTYHGCDAVCFLLCGRHIFKDPFAGRKSGWHTYYFQFFPTTKKNERECHSSEVNSLANNYRSIDCSHKKSLCISNMIF